MKRILFILLIGLVLGCSGEPTPAVDIDATVEAKVAQKLEEMEVEPTPTPQKYKLPVLDVTPEAQPTATSEPEPTPEPKTEMLSSLEIVTEMLSSLEIVDSVAWVGICAKFGWDPGSIDDICPEGPADLAGIKGGDQIIEINGEDILGLDRDGVISKLEARFDIEIGTSIDLTIQRSGESEPIKITVVTDEIIAPGDPMTTANISEIELEKIINSQPNVLVYFFSSNCGACAASEEAVNKFRDMYSDEIILIKLNVYNREYSSFVVENSVYTTPSFVQFENGTSTKNWSGMIEDPKVLYEKINN
jgi:thiol-disulfide isomerase/thioredoxin